eukprot:scaffold124075_cov26-Prasinocladus_malaysianus.AAC.1
MSRLIAFSSPAPAADRSCLANGLRCASVMYIGCSMVGSGNLIAVVSSSAGHADDNVLRLVLLRSEQQDKIDNYQMKPASFNFEWAQEHDGL